MGRIWLFSWFPPSHKTVSCLRFWKNKGDFATEIVVGKVQISEPSQFTKWRKNPLKLDFETLRSFKESSFSIEWGMLPEKLVVPNHSCLRGLLDRTSGKWPTRFWLSCKDINESLEVEKSCWGILHIVRNFLREGVWKKRNLWKKRAVRRTC